MSVLFFDTNSEVNYKLAKDLKLDNCIKMPYIIKDNEYYYDLGENYDINWFLNLIKEGNMPSTAGLNPENYKEYLEPFFAKGEDILYISFSESFSATFKSMDKAIEELKTKYPDAKFARFDSKAISMGYGLQVIEAAKMHNSGASNEEIVKFLEEFCPKINSYIYVEDLHFLKSGGRLSAGQAFFGSLLKIKPIIKLDKQGKLNVYEKVNGTKKVHISIAKQVAENVRELDKYPIYIIDAGNKDGANLIKNKIINNLPEEQAQKANIIIQDVGPVICSHCGPGTVGVCFVGEERPASIEAK